jgi:hypothetical protein
MTADIPAGWYPDPANPSGVRWWDGTGWTERASQPSVATTTVNIDEEASRARRARIGLLLAVPAQVAAMALVRIQFGDFVDHLRELDTTGGRIQPDFTRNGWGAASQLAGAVGMVVGVLFLLWFVRSAHNALALGLPARREPAAGVAGFIIPIINLWWPYRSMIDLLPPGDTHRPLVLRWFLLWMVGASVGAVVTWVAVFVDGWLGWALLAVPAVLTTLAALAARHLIGEIVDCHTALAGRPAPTVPRP